MANLLDDVNLSMARVQESIPSTSHWRTNADDMESELWYALNRGVQQPDGSYFGPEIGPRQRYDQFGNEIGTVEIRPYETARTIDDILLGYDSREGSEGFYPEYDSDMIDDAWILSMYPGAGGKAIRGLGNAAFARYMGKEMTGGRRLGALDFMFGGSIAGSGVRNVKRLGETAKRLNQARKARAAYDKALRARALPLPEPNAKVLEEGRLPFSGYKTRERYIDPNTEWADVEAIY